MRKLVTAASILALSAGAASADKLAEPMVEPEIQVAPAPAPAFNWTGAYAGLGLGVTNMRDRVSFNPTFDVDGSGVGLFGFAGYNFQLDNNFVVGVEGDLGYNRVTATGEPSMRPRESEDFTTAMVAPQMETRLRTSGSLRLRAGYAMDRTLFYGTGGIAMGRYTANDGFNDYSETRTGWTIGAGLEQALEGGWTIRGEYRFTDFGTATIGADSAGMETTEFRNGSQINSRLRTHEFRVGAAFRF
ncbi:MAG: porin family protein [Rhodobacteraceae bacterium]|nr:porin family protein [Paracoccaceae bacterium]